MSGIPVCKRCSIVNVDNEPVWIDGSKNQFSISCNCFTLYAEWSDRERVIEAWTEIQAP